MAHKTMIDGTSYEISGGKTLIDGATYSITGGKTLVDGATYGIEFGKPPSKYLTFSSDTLFTLSKAGSITNWDGIIYYSFNAKEWIKWNGRDISSNIIYLCGKNNTKIDTTFKFAPETAKIYCTGDIESLLDYEVVEQGGHPAMAEYCFESLFKNCTGLIQAPSLPATTLAAYCYQAMFYGCTSLTAVPDLPATTLTDKCYYQMFYECTSLTVAPSLSATTLAADCCAYMFFNCRGLTAAPSLSATALADRCYYLMFGYCTSLTAIPSLPATTLADRCYYQMFQGCTSIKLAEWNYNDYPTPYRIPISGNITNEANRPCNMMFVNTGGKFTGTPELNKTYYLHSSNSIVY